MPVCTKIPRYLRPALVRRANATSPSVSLYIARLIVADMGLDPEKVLGD